MWLIFLHKLIELFYNVLINYLHKRANAEAAAY